MTMLHANISINDPPSLIYFAAFYDLCIGVVWYQRRPWLRPLILC